MAQQVINVGTVANDRTGDSWRAAMVKVNENTDELYAALGSIVYVAVESDFPTQDATTITLDANTLYVLSADLSTGKSFTCSDGSSITGWNQNGYELTYTGTGSMFNVTDASFFVHDMCIKSATAQVFNIEDTIGGVHTFRAEAIEIVEATKWGTFDDLRVMIVNSCGAPDVDDGMSFVGSNWVGLLINSLGMNSTSAGFKGVDLDAAVIPFLDIVSARMFAPAGAYGISGVVSSGNLPTGSVANVENCAFLSAMTDLENITVDDVRWNFQNNNPTADTFPAGMVSINGNTTETVIAAVDTPVKAAGTGTVEIDSFFTVDGTGKMIYDGERDKPITVDINVTIEAASGTNKSISIYLAKNGTVIANSAKTNIVGASDARNTSVLWLLTLVETDYVEIFVENNTDAVNLIVTDGILRVH